LSTHGAPSPATLSPSSSAVSTGVRARVELPVSEAASLESMTVGPISSRPAWREVLGLTLVAPLAAACITPADPLLIQGNFPWFVLIPLLLGAQHGALAAALSTGLLGGLGVLHAQFGVPEYWPRLGAFAGGALAVGVIAGHFRDRVAARLTALGERAAADTERLGRLSRAHTVLTLSHHRLEEHLAARSWSLASAFKDVERALSGATSLATVGEVVLNVLSNHAQVQSASLVSVAPGRRGQLALEVGASSGGAPEVDLEHPLVKRALATGRLVALDPESNEASEESSILAVAPLRSVGGRWLGLVLIHELPFMAFQAENLKNLAALTAMLADLLEERLLDGRSGAAASSEVRAATFTAVPATPSGVALELELDEMLGESSHDPQSGDSDFVGTHASRQQRRLAQSA